MPPLKHDGIRLLLTLHRQKLLRIGTIALGHRIYRLLRITVAMSNPIRSAMHSVLVTTVLLPPDIDRLSRGAFLRMFLPGTLAN